MATSVVVNLDGIKVLSSELSSNMSDELGEPAKDGT